MEQRRRKKRPIINPANEEIIIEINEASQQQAVGAIQAARHAFQYTDWPFHPAKRIAALRQLADLLEQNAETFASIETLNTGKPIRESRLDVSDSILCLRYYADFVEQRAIEETKRTDGTTSKIIEEPIGVCALIVPWNFPLLLGIWKLAPALAAGNTVVFKPSELTPLSFIELTKLIDSIGLPPGVFNLVPGGGSPVGETLVTHPDVEKTIVYRRNENRTMDLRTRRSPFEASIFGTWRKIPAAQFLTMRIFLAPSSGRCLPPSSIKEKCVWLLREFLFNDAFMIRFLIS